MAYSLKTINDAIRSDPKAFAEECDLYHRARVILAAEVHPAVFGEVEHEPVFGLGRECVGQNGGDLRLDGNFGFLRNGGVGLDFNVRHGISPSIL